MKKLLSALVAGLFAVGAASPVLAQGKSDQPPAVEKATKAKGEGKKADPKADPKGEAKKGEPKAAPK